MKKIVFFSIFLFTAPLLSGPSCINKQGHSLACPCNCDAIKGRYCIDCTHLQNAQNYTVITGQNNRKQNTKNINDRSRDPQDVLNKLAVRYLQNK